MDVRERPYPRERKIGLLQMIVLFPMPEETKRYFEVGPELDVIVTASSTAEPRFMILKGAERDQILKLTSDEAFGVARIMQDGEASVQSVEVGAWDRICFRLERGARKVVLSDEAFAFKLQDGDLVVQKRGALLPILGHLRFSRFEAANFAAVILNWQTGFGEVP